MGRLAGATGPTRGDVPEGDARVAPRAVLFPPPRGRVVHAPERERLAHLHRLPSVDDRVRRGRLGEVDRHPVDVRLLLVVPRRDRADWQGEGKGRRQGSKGGRRSAWFGLDSTGKRRRQRSATRTDGEQERRAPVRFFRSIENRV